MSKAKTTRAVVMELAPKKMVVYTQRGEFREVRLPKIVPEIGQVNKIIVMILSTT